MAELEKLIIPQLGDKISLWQRYVDDTCTFIKKGETEAVLDVLNGFHESINFTYEKEGEGAISFLDIKLMGPLRQMSTGRRQIPTSTCIGSRMPQAHGKLGQ